MNRSSSRSRIDTVLFVSVLLLTGISISVLTSIVPFLFPSYFVFTALGIAGFIFFSRTDFDILMYFSRHLYWISVGLLVTPLLFGVVTRGAIRWITIGELAVQPSEIVRPFLILFAAWYLTAEVLTFNRLLRFAGYALIPVMLILVQPSFGVSILTSLAFLGVLLASTVNKKYIMLSLIVGLLFVPVSWYVMAPYQKERVMTFLNPTSDPLGAGYNSIQSMISVGSGKFFGRGLGKGVQTQLDFLPERHNDFIFASIAEELGLVGVMVLMVCLFMLFWRLTNIIDRAKNPTARAFVSGLFFVLFFQTIFNIGMNMGLFPITGIPLPLVSSGGSSYIATLLALGIASNCMRKQKI